MGVSNIKKAIVVFILFLGLLYWFTTSTNEASNLKTQSELSALKSSSIAKNTEIIPKTGVSKISQDMDYNTCSTLLIKHDQTKRDWLSPHDNIWQQLLTQGYSLDEVTSAMYFFFHENWASGFRVKQLRKDSQYSIRTQTLNEEIRASVPQIAQAEEGLKDDVKGSSIKSISFSFSIPIPSHALAKIMQLDHEQKVKLLTEVKPSVDDVAFFINEPSVSNDDILILISFLEDPFEKVNYKDFDTISLLDYAAATGRLSVVQELLSLGIMPTNDKFLNSSMEWALRGLTNKIDTSEYENAAELVLLLQGLGGKARFREQSIELVTSNTPRNWFHFEKESIQSLKIDFGLDILSINSKALPEINEESGLIKKMKNEQEEFVSNTLNQENLSKQLSDCRIIQESVKQTWRPASARELTKLAMQSTNDRKTIEASLSVIDPQLIDLYRQGIDAQKRKYEATDELQKNKMKFRSQTISEILDKWLKKPLSQANKNWLFHALVSSNPNRYEELATTELFIDNLQNYEIASLQILYSTDFLKTFINTGADLHSVDSLGKTLLYYAAQSSTAEVLALLQEENVPFYGDYRGRDPLHAVLERNDFLSDDTSLLLKLSILMKYQPTIDKFHLSRMRRIKLFNPSLYEKIVESHLGLGINKKTFLPIVSD